MTTTEVLRTQVDSLKWEVNRLDSENLKLRAENEAASKVLDLEAELERTRQDSTAELRACQEKLADAEQALSEAERRATEVESRALEAEERNQRAEEAHETELSELRQEIVRLENDVELNAGCVTKLTREARARTDELEEVLDEHQKEKEAILQREELRRYRCLEEERQKWEAREVRLVSELEYLKRSHKPLSSASDASVQLRSQLQALTEELASTKSRVQELTDTSMDQALMIEEQEAEIALLKTKLKRAERGYPVSVAVCTDRPLSVESSVSEAVCTDHPVSTESSPTSVAVCTGCPVSAESSSVATVVCADHPVPAESFTVPAESFPMSVAVCTDNCVTADRSLVSAAGYPVPAPTSVAVCTDRSVSVEATSRSVAVHLGSVRRESVPVSVCNTATLLNSPALSATPVCSGGLPRLAAGMSLAPPESDTSQ